MTLNQERAIDFTVLLLRWYLAYYMIDYGWSKMTGGQFGVQDAAILNKPLKEVDKFHLAWYLFGLDKSFDIINGLFQIAGGLLIIYNRTALLGALMLLPILGQIFLVDLAFTTNMFGPALVIRLAGMMVADLLILYYHKDRMIAAWHALTDKLSTRFRYRWWVYLLLPILGFAVDFVIAGFTFPLRQLIIWMNR